jgi:hypothetical protein
MRGALIHGVLLAVMLIYGYRTWTRDKTVQPDRGSVVLWDKSEPDLTAVEYKSEKKIVRLEQRSDATGPYWWGSETTIEKRPKPVEKKPEEKPAEPAAGSGSAGSGSAGSGSAGSGSAATPPPPPVEMEEVKKTVEFPIGEGGTKLLEAYFKARALRDLGVPTDALKKDYKLDAASPTSTLTVTFKDGTKREFVIGGSVYNTAGGSSDRYVMDKQSGKAYVLSKDLLGNLEIGQSSLNLTDPRGFDATQVGSVQIETPSRKPKMAARITTGAEGQQVKTWGDPETKKADQTLANFVDNTANLRPTEYKAQLKIESLQPVVKLIYKDERGSKLGTLALYKIEKPGQLPEGAELDPANPPPGELEYYIVTEKTRVPGLVRKDTAQRTEQDLPVVFGEKEPEKKVDPSAPNPFGNTPLPPREKTPPADPHAGSAAGAPPADPHAGLGLGSAGSAPAAGSAAAPGGTKPPAAGSAAAPGGTKPPAAGASKPPTAGAPATPAPKPPTAGAPATPAPKPPAAAGGAAAAPAPAAH